ncbi:MAG: V-type ATP synthase subunit D [Candidatus Hydrogenedentota bacterium]
MSMDSAPATRMTMMTKKASIKLASDGVSLLEGKREALLTELIDRAKELKLLRNDLHIRGRASIGSLAIARAAQGTAGVRSMGVAGKRELSLSVEKEKVWGMDLGTIKAQNIVRTPAERGVGLIDTSSHILEAAQAAESMLEQLVKCAPLERNIQMIGEEIKKTNRRINALNEYLLPKLRGEVRAIARVLEEREREDTFRLKKIKSKGSSNDVTGSLL